MSGHDQGIIRAHASGQPQIGDQPRVESEPRAEAAIEMEAQVPQQAPQQQRGGARIEVSSDRGVFMISVAAELANMHPQTLRTYESKGLIAPKRSPKGTRLYSHEDVERLRRIQEMTVELGLNLAGVERVLELEEEVRDMNRRIEELELHALASEARLARELEALRRSFKAELVLYDDPSRPGREVVLASDVRSAFRGLRRRPHQARAGGLDGNGGRHAT